MRSEEERAEELFLAFADTVLEHMKKNAAENPPRRHMETRTGFGEHFSTRAETVWDVTYDSLLYARQDSDFRSTDCAKQCARHHVENGIISVANLTDESGKPLTDPAPGRVESRALDRLLDPVVLAVRDCGGLSPSLSLLREWYGSCKQEWKRPATFDDAVIPLLNFSCEEDQFSVDDTLEVARLTSDDKTEIYSGVAGDITLLWRAGIWKLHMAGCKFQLRGTYDKTGREARSMDMAETDVRLFVTALRLHSSGSVGAPIICWKGPLRQNQSRYSSGLTLPTCRIAGLPEASHLRASEIPSVVSLFNNLQIGDERGWLKHLRIGLNRFNQTYDRESSEDVLIDLVIALESCLLAGGSGELRFRFAMRGAALLADVTPPHVTRRELETMYDVRSGIVHGGKSISDFSDKLGKVGLAPRPIDRCREITRHVLKAYVEKLLTGTSIKRVNRELETCLLNSLGPALPGTSDTET